MLVDTYTFFLFFSFYFEPLIHFTRALHSLKKVISMWVWKCGPCLFCDFCVHIIFWRIFKTRRVTSSRNVELGSKEPCNVWNMASQMSLFDYSVYPHNSEFCPWRQSIKNKILRYGVCGGFLWHHTNCCFIITDKSYHDAIQTRACLFRSCQLHDVGKLHFCLEILKIRLFAGTL